MVKAGTVKMPVYDYRNVVIGDLPDQICLVLKPTQNPTGDVQEYQSGALTIDLCGIVGYLPIYRNYQQAIQDHPNSHIYVMDLTEYKRKIGLLPPDKVI